MPDLKYFVSDFHFGAGLAGDDKSFAQFERFCSLLPCDAQLYILGDCFDFWIEHKYTVRLDFVKIYTVLINTKKRGVKIFMVRGNHDFIRGNFFEKLGFEVSNDEIKFETGVKKVCCIHGDGISRDFFYSAMKFILRSAFFQFFYKTLHPTISIWLAQLASYLSRNKNKEDVKSATRKERYRKYALEFLEKHRFDVLIMGHSHIFDLYKAGGKIYANCGAWFEKPTYVSLYENKLFLKEFCGDIENDVVLEEVEMLV